jgi:hypothetical protein
MRKVKVIYQKNPLQSIFIMMLQFITGVIGWNLHHSVFFTIIDVVFMPIIWLKWFIFQEVNLEFIKNCFNWFFQ